MKLSMDERSKRQEEIIDDWVKAGCRATIECATGSGKTRMATIAINRFLKKNPNGKILVVVPTHLLKKQWEKNVKENNINAKISVINTAAKTQQSVDFLIIDEFHRAASVQLIKLFNNIRYGMILGLTATLERLDSRDQLLRKYAPICHTLTLEECIEKGWLAPNYNYKLIIDVDDIDIYNKYNKEFLNHFAYFDFDFNAAMSCVTSYQNRLKYVNDLIRGRKELFKETMKECTAHTFAWNKALQKRKEFVSHHPKKLEIAKKILNARPEAKAITFNATISDCESYGFGYVVHSEKKKKENEAILKEFNDKDCCAVLHTAKSCNEGVDINGLNLGIILYNSSSSTERTQRVGRTIRYSPNKVAEIFSIVINNTVEMNWHKASSKNTSFIEINEYDLDKILKNEKINKEKQFQKEVKYLMTC